jgi:hypothetical protein
MRVLVAACLVALAAGCGGEPETPCTWTDCGLPRDAEGQFDRFPDGGDAATSGDAGVGDAGGDAGGGDGGTPGCGTITTFEDGLAPTKEVHVATPANGGNDGTGNGSAGAPYATIDRAVDDATPGTAIRVHWGSYAGGTYIENLAGTAAAPIWIGGAPGEDKPLITGGLEGLHLSRVRYLIVHDLHVNSPDQNGINCDDGGDYSNEDATRFVIFRNLVISGVGAAGNEDALKLSGVNDYFVLDTEFNYWGTGGGSGIDHVGCHRGLIARSHFVTPGDNAVQTKGGSSDIEIRWNWLYHVGGQRGVNIGGSTGLQYFRPPLSTAGPNSEASNVRVVANVIVGGWAALAFVGCLDCLAANNTIIDPENWILRILQETTTSGGYVFLPCGRNTFVNNLVYFSRGDLSTWVNIGPNTAPDTFTFSHNLWYAHDDPGASSPASDLPVTEIAPVVGQDPQIPDPSGGNLRIPMSSPAAAAGVPLAGIVGDASGACYATPPSIGAFQAK